MSVSQKGRQPQQKSNAVRIAVSACLLGHKVRYDGGDKKNSFVLNQLAEVAQLLPVCPEVEIGMGVPRPPIHIVEIGGRLRAIGVADPGQDVTEKLTSFGRRQSRQLGDVCGYIFKARSPSCGVTGTPIVLDNGHVRRAAGLFAAEVMRQLPLLPVVEEGRLETTAQQINFLQRVVAYRHWLDFINSKPGWRELQLFHQHNQLALMAHGVEGLRKLEAWLAGMDQRGRFPRALLFAYGERYMAQFARQATVRRQVFVLRRCAALLRPVIIAREYSALLAEIERYVAGKRSLADVIGRLGECQRHVCLPELEGQTYLSPRIWSELHP